MPASASVSSGKSGSGKTTTALALMHMIKAPGRITSGSAMLGEMDLLALKGPKIREARLSKMSYVPQGAMNALNPVLRIGEQILDGIADHEIALNAAQQRALVAEALASVGLPEGTAARYPHQFSGGMKQRACIAIAISLKPQLIIADEPTSALDVITQRQVMDTLCSVQQRIGCGLILIGHDMGLMAQVADRMIVMQDGLIAEIAPVRELFRNPRHSYSRMLIESVPSLAKDSSPRAAEPVSAAHETREPLLVLDRVGKSFGGGIFSGKPKTALEPCTLRLDGADPRIVAVVGQSGSGKTTLARMILGFEKPTTGRVLYRGQDIARLSGARAAQVPERSPGDLPGPLRLVQSVLQGRQDAGPALVTFGLATGRREVYARMQEACEAVGLTLVRSWAGFHTSSRRTAAKAHGRPRLAAASKADRCGRACLDGRRLDAHDDPRQHAAAQGCPWHLDHLHHT